MAKIDISLKDASAVWSYIQDQAEFMGARKVETYRGTPSKLRELVRGAEKRHAAMEFSGTLGWLNNEAQAEFNGLLRLIARRQGSAARRDRSELMADCGLVKGRDSMGRVIWE